MNDPHCAQVKAALYAFLDGEVEDADADVIREHLAACEPCMDDLEIRVAVQRILQRCCCQERAPETLRTRVITQITVSRTTHWQI